MTIDRAVARITLLHEQPVLRNLLITQGYHELSAAFASVLGRTDITWFTFASWSSKVVGQFIRNERVPALLRPWIEGAGDARERLARLNRQLKSLHSQIHDAPAVALDLALRSAVNDTRLYLAVGNTEVFAELAPVFGGFLHAFGPDVEPDYPRLDRFTASLLEGPPEPDRVAIDPHTHALQLLGLGGQTLLAEAVRHYYDAKFEADPKRRAELVLLANAKIGLHEQTRLQTYIEGALNAPVGNMLAIARKGLVQLARGDDALGSRWADRTERMLAPIVSHAQLLFARFATELLMALKLPDGTVGLAADLPAAPGHRLYPRALERIEHPELAAILEHYQERGTSLSPPPRVLARGESTDLLFAKLGLRRASAQRSGATNWASLRQRMRFILELFRSRQQNQRMLEPVFSPAQVAALEAGLIPDGPLT